MRAIIADMLSRPETNAPDLYTVAKTYEFLSCFASKISTFKRKSEAKYSDNLNKVVEYIHRNYYRDLSITEICEKFGFERSTLYRMFIREFGVSTELRNYKKKLIETETNKANLEETIDNLPLDTKYRERKLKDMSARLDSLYDTINELEECIKDASLRRAAMEEEVLTLDNVYKLLLSFDKIYDIMSDKEKKDLISYLIKDIQIYSNEEQVEMPLKSITLNFPIYSDSGEVNKLLWENRDGVETLVLLSHKEPDSHITRRGNVNTISCSRRNITGK